MRPFLAPLVPAILLSLGALACSANTESAPSTPEPPTSQVSDGLASEGQSCDTDHPCEAGLACAVRDVRGGDLSTKGKPPCDCGAASSSSSSGTNGQPTPEPTAAPETTTTAAGICITIH